MKLVEILARELKEWPGGCVSLVQESDKELFIGTGFLRFSQSRTWRGEGVYFDPTIYLSELADDWKESRVTRAQWEAERERIAANKQATQEARDIARNGNMTSEEQELAGIACGKRSKEDQGNIKEVTSAVSVGYTLERDYEAEEAKQYDQELWDKVAIAAINAILPIEYVRGAEYIEVASECFEYADFFMAERAKRMK